MSVEKTEKIWHNGKFIDWHDAKVHVLSHVIHYGSGVFEGIRCYQTEETVQRDPRDIAAARAALTREIAPIDDIRSTLNYRLRVAGNLLEEFIEQL